MKNETIKDSFIRIKDDAVDYLNLQLTYYELLLTKKLVTALSSIMTFVFVAFFTIMILIMLSFAFVYWYGTKVGTIWQAFLIISGFYLILGLILYLICRKTLTKSISKLLIDNSLGNESNSAYIMSRPKNMSDIKNKMDGIKLSIHKNKLDFENDINAIADKLTFRNFINSIYENAVIITGCITSIKNIFHSFKSQREEQKEDTANTEKGIVP